MPLIHSLLKLKFFLLIRYHVTEYCAVIGTHSTVCGDKLLFGHVPDHFPWCGHARLISTSI